MSADLERAIRERGRTLFADIRGEKPSLFDTAGWTGKLLDWAMRREAFKVQLFRFVDVFPSLAGGEALARHLDEYFGGEAEVPRLLRWGARAARLTGPLGARLLGAAIRSRIEGMARQFIIGEGTPEAVRTLTRLRRDGFAAVVDLLGEASVSETEADTCLRTYRDLVEALRREQEGWPALSPAHAGSELDWGYAPKLQISVKPTSLYSQANPMDHEGSVRGILARLRPIYEAVADARGLLCIDMESSAYKEITLEVYRRLRADPRLRAYPGLGVVLQAYLREGEADLDRLLAWSRAESLPLHLRLVKGAYWDAEVAIAGQKGWPPPVWLRKAETDRCFERMARRALEAADICFLACGSHNVRSIAAVLETARALAVPPERYELQVLYGMAEPVRRAVLKQVGRVRLYAPYGRLLPGMAYLVRRLLENTSNESFLRQSFAEGAEVERLLESPEDILARTPAPAAAVPAAGEFANEPQADFRDAGLRAAFPSAIGAVRRQLGRRYPLHVAGRDVATTETADSVNPADPAEVIGRVSQAGAREADEALAAAARAFPAWRDTPAGVRARHLVKAAAAARGRRVELATWEVLEAGKQWDQAYADVAEAIDFFEYYAREMGRLAAPRRLGRAPGESNLYGYEGRGVAAIIAPWNFPLAISAGMCAAALVAGNTVVYKPSGFTAVIGRLLLEVLRASGLPPGVFNYLPGRGSVIGDRLVDSPLVSVIGFTGSLETGLRILERAARVHPGQVNVKRVICEMGGKNAIVVDDDADLDEAVPAVLHSAFGYQGQKCSACSRVIILDAVYDRFASRLVEAARAWRIGPAEDPANAMGPVIDASAQKSILEYAEIARREGRLLYESDVPAGEGFYVPMTIVEGIRPEHRIAQEEVFGPVLAVMRAADFDEALRWANATRFALTGGVFSRSPRHLERARQEFRVGNLYLNRGVTGALVERQPFGGSRMSGLGTKAGGPDYLLQFMDPRAVTENTLRRGFTPDLLAPGRE
jgi:RHH-type proline utilization regulon transcriptional repressor/proline dehydrogenase/delta 1-pyrroline-5-carboxylate dehydrogenase